MSILYIVHFALKYFTIIYVATKKAQILSDKFWNRVAYLSSENIDEQKALYEVFYWLNDGKKNLK